MNSDYTVNPLYTDIRYNDKTRINGSLNGTKLLLKVKRILYLIFQETYVVDIC